MNKVREYKTPKGCTWYRLGNDAYGNPRIMTHFMNLVSPSQTREARKTSAQNGCESLNILEQWARDAVNGKNYRARWFGGGITWKSYLNDAQINDLIDAIVSED